MSPALLAATATMVPTVSTPARASRLTHPAAAKTDAYNHGGGVPSNATSISVEVFGRLATLDVSAAATFYLALRIGGVNYLSDAKTIIASSA